MKQRIAIIDGIRTPMGKAGMSFKDIGADDLAAKVVHEIIARNNISPEQVDELIFGNVAQPGNAANIARVIALKAGLPETISAYTVNRNCGSGMESITTSAYKLLTGDAKIIVAGGTESMSQIPLLFNKQMTDFFAKLFKSKTIFKKIKTMLGFRLRFLKPVIGVQLGLTDPVSGMIMGKTAEVLAKEFAITRLEQDEYALLSHNRAETAAKNNIFQEEILPFYIEAHNGKLITEDEGIRKGQNLKALQKLKPYFDRKNGTVTVGNSSQLTDGAAAVLLMTEKQAKSLKLKPLGYLREFAYSGLEPERMGLGPTYAAAKLFDKTKLSLENIDLIELNEAFAAQVIANERAFASDEFSQKYLGRKKALGKINRKIMNVNGGAIALGHPVGMTGTRIVIHTLKELKRRKKTRGLATLCIGGGQGAALLLETK